MDSFGSRGTLEVTWGAAALGCGVGVGRRSRL